MILGARMLDNVLDANNFNYTQQLRMTSGDAPAVYFILIDKSKDEAGCGFSPAGRRYVPPATSTLSVVLDNIDDDKRVTRFATQPFALDPSIWRIQLLTTDVVYGTVNLKLTLAEPTRSLYGTVANAIGVESVSGLVL